VVEFVEGEPNKFLVAAEDHRLHFKASSLEEKQHWVTSIRSSILTMSTQTAIVNKKLLELPEAITQDLQTASPNHKRVVHVGNGDVVSLAKSSSSSSMQSRSGSTQEVGSGSQEAKGEEFQKVCARYLVGGRWREKVGMPCQRIVQQLAHVWL